MKTNKIKVAVGVLISLVIIGFIPVDGDLSRCCMTRLSRGHYKDVGGNWIIPTLPMVTEQWSWVFFSFARSTFYEQIDYAEHDDDLDYYDWDNTDINTPEWRSRGWNYHQFQIGIFPARRNPFVWSLEIAWYAKEPGGLYVGVVLDRHTPGEPEYYYTYKSCGIFMSDLFGTDDHLPISYGCSE